MNSKNSETEIYDVPDRSESPEVVHGNQPNVPEKPYVCQICGRRYKEKRYLFSHKKNHLGIRNYKCEYCKKMFHTRFENVPIFPLFPALTHLQTPEQTLNFGQSLGNSIVEMMNDPDLSALVVPLLPTIQDLMNCDFRELTRRKPAGVLGGKSLDESPRESCEETPGESSPLENPVKIFGFSTSTSFILSAPQHNLLRQQQQRTHPTTLSTIRARIIHPMRIQNQVWAQTSQKEFWTQHVLYKNLSSSIF
ncbi:hypothetical protein L5515_015880 [Caenorhabditis briggsae]|uniref:C2H2-type domain-containing protein n=1 Tax=Caenorhabditis briggsae TaxID=6238 RepID=A0AAE9J9U5_CAEBR|nr:hypothetical protein L5515_015880 [Caenorhabditis briggsae]